MRIYEKTLGIEHPFTADAWLNLGKTHTNLGEYAKAKDCDERALAIRLKLFGEEHADTALSLLNLGVAHCRLGSHLKEREYYERAVAIYRKVLGNEHPKTLFALNNLGNTYYHFSDYGKAKEYHEEILTFRRKGKVSDKDDEDNARTFSSLAADYSGLGDYAKAKEYDERALAIRLKILGEEHPDTAGSLENLGFDYYRLGDYAKAKEHYERVLAIRLKILGGEHPDTAVSFSFLGDVYSTMGQKDTAILYKKMAVNITQMIRANLTTLDEDLQKSFLNSKDHRYKDLADLLTEQGRIPEAQQVLAMLKEEEYFDFIRRDEKRDPRVSAAAYSGLEQKQADRFGEIGGRLFDLTKEKEELRKKKKSVSDEEWDRSGDAKRLLQVDEDLKLANKVFLSFIAALEKEMENISNAERKKEIDQMQLKLLQGFRGTLRDMEHGAALIHTLVTDERLWIILTTPDVQLSYESPVSQNELSRKIRDFGECLKGPSSDPYPLAKELYDILIAPMAKDLEKAKAQTLMFYLDGPLRYIPIAALHDGEKWLAEKYALAVYTEAARDKLKDRHKVKEWEASAFGVTKEHEGFDPLPAVRGELESIIRGGSGAENTGLPGDIMLDEEFDETAFADALYEGIPVVHVASHFSFNTGTVADSFLLLGDGKHLSLEEIQDGNYRFDKVDHVTLSACETALGSGKGDGREVEGLGAVVQNQGAKSVMATLWSVADQSTGIFMARFYTLLQQEGMTKAEAMRRTQAEFIDGRIEKTEAYATVMRGKTGTAENIGGTRGESPQYRGYSHPYFWAPFILMGNWL
ncbi:MAG: tetratricopeptide repeat protein [Synergistaceae bacterium]|nr:tetratricopeptide repeat protein [Synergistaceae bacterium]